ncbi:hypothetical protein [Chondromyces crocatus]|uniref:hypothetical protein n=1 Tax=Chondromyces crocatus TaxID=52 RepID=UPI00067D6A51|nr:hypothetical protein [Chondromyces crocatus]
MKLDASERRALIGSALSASTLLLLPRQWVSAGMAAALTVALYVWHQVRTSKEEAASPAPATAGGATETGGTSETASTTTTSEALPEAPAGDAPPASEATPDEAPKEPPAA